MRFIISLIATILPFVAQSVNLFYYSPSNGEGGLRLAVENENGKWEEIGKDFNFVSSDFGPWGSGKKMWNPRFYKEGNQWTLVFCVTPDCSVYGVTTSSDFIKWVPQKYYRKNDNDLEKILKLPLGENKEINLRGKIIEGRTVEVSPELIAGLESHVQNKTRKNALYSEKATDDSLRFADLKSVKGNLKITSEKKDISPLLMGIFFEDINYAADGGLYGELIQNRDFEYKETERSKDGWGPKYAWEIRDPNIREEIRDISPIHPNNSHYINLNINRPAGATDLKGLLNKGYDGITLKDGEDYIFSMKYRADSSLPVTVNLVNDKGEILSSNKLTLQGNKNWQDIETTLHVEKGVADAMLEIVPLENGELDLDMISLFPAETYKGRRNGLRKDLAETLADLKPKFVRFPGGCVAHGNGIDNIYDWKGSVGKLEEREPLFNLWGYHQTRGLGYHEYFQFCEDIGAEPLPVVAAGVPCQNSGNPSKYTVDEITRYGQQEGIPMDSLDNYIQDILDLIEYANGGTSTYWGAKRAKNGHVDPFNLKYLGLGNEDMITEVFEERFAKIHNAIKEKYPEITVIGTVGPFYEGSDYDEGWRFARQENVDMVDEHYYVEPGWLIYNQDFYDDYDREGPKVYLGEWAAHLPDRASNIETALSEALYLTSVERNGDVVSMSSYAPLLAKKGHTQWRPDLIYFDNDSVYLTPDYHVMRLFGENSGDKYVKSNLQLDNDNDKVKARIGASVVTDEETGETIIKLVNLLPVTTDLSIDLSDLVNEADLSGKSAKVITLRGEPGQGVADIKEEIKVLPKTNFDLSLPEYSFTLIRLSSI